MQACINENSRIVGTLTIVSGVLALGSMLTGLIATNFDSEAFSNPVLILNMESATPSMIRWFMLLDMFGYYLLLLPVIFYVHKQAKYKSSWTSLVTFSGYGYVIIGAIGAAMLAAAWPSLIVKFRQAQPEHRQLYQELFLLTNELVVKGVWNILEMFLASAWWIGVAFLVPVSRSLRITTVALGVACVVDAVGEMLGLEVVAETGLNVYLVAAIVWAVWFGVAVLRARASRTPSASRFSNPPSHSNAHASNTVRTEAIPMTKH